MTALSQTAMGLAGDSHQQTCLNPPPNSTTYRSGARLCAVSESEVDELAAALHELLCRVLQLVHGLQARGAIGGDVCVWAAGVERVVGVVTLLIDTVDNKKWGTVLVT